MLRDIFLFIILRLLFTVKNREYDQEIPQSQTADKPMAPRGRAKRVKPVLSSHSKENQRFRFSRLIIAHNAGQKYCTMLQESILQYFRHALSYHLSLRPLFLPIFELPLKTDLTVFYKNSEYFPLTVLK